MFLNAKGRQRVAGVPPVVATAVAQSQAQSYAEVCPISKRYSCELLVVIPILTNEALLHLSLLITNCELVLAIYPQLLVIQKTND
ncbi:hypothetical protein FACHB389_06650 [Nostoc calcicola FACHB-389]|nr:hypothetical protein FACHB389_06650 [Nostoc calcicola FACHB-389]